MSVDLRPTSTARGDADQLVALSAPVRDPLWMLARQWLTGAFVAEDGGTPVHVSLAFATAPLCLDGAPLASAVEPVIEAESPALDGAARIRLGAELIRRLRDEGDHAPLVSDLAAAFPLAGAPFHGRVPDGGALLQALSGHAADTQDLPSLPGVDPTLLDAAAAAVRSWCVWAAGQAGSGRIAPDAWDPQRLEYRFDLTSAPAGGALTLHATGYDGTGADWHAFDRDPMPTAPASADAMPVEVRPVPVTYAGMPRPRFWELEDGQVNLDALRDGTDAAHAVLATFAHQYANDWFVVPLELEAGACLITRLDVVDTFGAATTIPSVATLDGGTGPWRLWEISGAGGDLLDAATGVRVLPPVAPPPLEGPVLEQIVIVRDELANLAWLIELITTGDDGKAVDRYRRWLALRRPAQARADGMPTYRLGTEIPDFWYPLIASDQGLLALATVPPEATGVGDDGVRGQIVVHAAGMTIADEEASREGTGIIRRDRLSLTPQGLVVWRARIKGPGKGESSSGLRFDVLA